jgi:hypothetical protein
MFARCELANAIRTLSMNAVQKPKPFTRVPRWVWLTLPKSCGVLS